jgi:hypothetical protein
MERAAVVAARPAGWPRRFTGVLFFFTDALILSIERVPVSIVAPILLAETSGWCTEGSDTKGLQEAKALLTELTGEVVALKGPACPQDHV